MRWMMRRKPKGDDTSTPQPVGERKAEEALGESLMQRIAADDQAEVVREIACSLQQIREHNHFAEALEELFGGAR